MTIASDPYFSTLFAGDHLEWTYPKNIGLEDNVEKRRLITVIHEGVPPPRWMPFTNMPFPMFPRGRNGCMRSRWSDFDYMSEGGKGWFKDIDALAAALSPAERRKVFLCLHGWYDWCGRYSFDVKTKQFDEQWTAFGNAPRYKDQHSIHEHRR